MYTYCYPVVSLFRNLHYINNILKNNIHKVVLTGIQPSGKPHLGNYLSVIKPCLSYVESNDFSRLFLLIADLHALTSQNNYNFSQNTFELLSILIACGFDNDASRTPIFLQSSVGSITELMWILSNVCSISRLSHLPQWREKSDLYLKEGTGNNKTEYFLNKEESDIYSSKNNVHIGLFTYPLLQAADIILFDSQFVPVGADQIAHVEIARDLVRSAINKWPMLSNVFKVPEAIVFDIPKINSLRNPIKKMSKSDTTESGTVYITDSPDQIRQKIRRAQTDSLKSITYDVENRPGVSNLLRILAVLRNRSVDEIASHASRWSKEELKNEVSEVLIEEFQPIQEKVFEMQNTESGYARVKSCLDAGTRQANQVAKERLELIRSAVGCRFPIYHELTQKRDTITIKERRLKWIGHVLCRSPTHPTGIVMEAHPLSGWKRRSGGQRKFGQTLWDVNSVLLFMLSPVVEVNYLIGHPFAANRDQWRGLTRNVINI